MHNRSKLLMAAIMAPLLLALGTGTTSANRSFSVVGGGNFRAHVLGLQFSSGFVNMTCDVTLNGSLHPAIAKTEGTLAGFVSEGRAANCVNNLGLSSSATLLVEPRSPWHITFVTFAGTLPRIFNIKIRVNGSLFLLRVGGVSCLYGDTFTSVVTGRTGAREFTGDSFVADANIARLIRAEGEEFFRRCSVTGEIANQIWILSGPTVTLI